MEFGLEEINIIDEKNQRRQISCVSLDTIIKNPHGLHARPSALVVKTAYMYDRNIYTTKLDLDSHPIGEKYSCKDIMDLISMDAGVHTKLRVYVQGQDPEAKRICEEIAQLFSSDFNEVYKDY